MTSSNPYCGRTDNDTNEPGDSRCEALMHSDGSLRQIIDSCFLRPTSRVFITSIMWLLARWDFALAAICFAIAGGYFLFLVLVTHHIFWDINFYAAVVKAMAAGMSPYNNDYIYNYHDLGYSTGFIYPPLVAEAFYKLRWLFQTSTGWVFIITAHVISWISIPYMLADSPKDWYSRNFLYVWGLYLVLFGLGGMRLLVVGNIAAILFALLILSIVVAIRTRNYEPFWVTIFLCSLVKFTFLGFLLVPIILDKKYLSAGLLIGAVIAAYALNYFITPALFTEYLAQISAQHSNSGYIGLSIFSLATALIKVPFAPNDGQLFAIAIGIHFIFVALVILLAYAIAERRVRPERFDLFCCWLVMSSFLISPRIFDYDLAIVIVPFVLLTRMLLTERGLGIGVAVTVAVLGSILLRTPSSFQTQLSDWSATFVIVGVWFGAAVHWLTADGKRELPRTC